MTKGRDYSVYVMDRKEAVLVTIISACICMFAGLLCGIYIFGWSYFHETCILHAYARCTAG